MNEDRLANAVAMAWDLLADKFDLDKAKIIDGKVFVINNMYIIPIDRLEFEIWKKYETSELLLNDPKEDCDCASAALLAFNCYIESLWGDTSDRLEQQGYGDLL